jgi:geranylgeranyl diphosphate synthase type II
VHQDTHPLTSHRTLIDTGLRAHLPRGGALCTADLNHAVEYAVFPGGKRLRPALALLGAEVAGCDVRHAVAAACAVEYLHTSSLIFDDLPAMDDAGMRRGRLAVHLRFGEDVALLAALTLLNRAYAIFGATPRLIAEAAMCIGERGMIGGQSVDLQSRMEWEDGPGSALFASRNQKTTALMRLTLTAGALACGASGASVAALARCGYLLGDAYQICDDMLDRFSPLEVTGKTAGQDERHHRPSHVDAAGTQACRDHAVQLVEAAKAAAVDQFGQSSAAPLCAAIDSIMQAFAAPLQLMQSGSAKFSMISRA